MLCFAALAFLHRPTTANPLQAPTAAAGMAKGRETGLPIPRFVSLKANGGRMRIGPSLEYAAKWVYTKRGVPFEITAEYDNWREVRDCDGVSGWMHRALLSSQRTAVVGPWLKAPVALHATPGDSSQITARLSARVGLQINSCDGDWCAVAVTGHAARGFLHQSSIWGVYLHEIIK
ncbi:SH3 domain-containing protein [Rhizobium sp. P32RR-XVIII]|uniref:SH3 domain-containing protein n=1 Tax=Rhizobium sp. P32RR-XVIII TaxID=2726738 RepID=UPI001FF02D76|nr:SH3 domain-containing protein [Rhizobium sp. P32RR-XVIII]